MDVALQNKVILKLMEFSVTPFKLIASSLKLYSPTLEKSWVPTLITCPKVGAIGPMNGVNKPSVFLRAKLMSGIH